MNHSHITQLAILHYTKFSDIPLARMTTYANEIIGEHQFGFRRNRSTVDHIRGYLAFGKYLN